MTVFMLLALALAVLAAAALTWPLWRVGPDHAAQTRRSAGLAAVLAIFVFSVAGGGYAWLGSPDRVVAAPQASSGVAAARVDGASPQARGDDASRAQAMAQVSAMVEQLAERLKSRPDDAAGWQMLARAQAALNQHAQAVDAFRKAASLRPDDATLLADFAFSLAMTNGRSFQGEPSTLVAEALALDPKNPKALALAGTVAFDRKDYAHAVQHWERLAQIEPAGSPFAQQIRTSIAQARQLAGMPAAATPVSDRGTPAAPPQAAAANAQVSGSVTLAPSLAARVSPDDTVFIFARAADGPRMPLAILRKRVKDLPLQFTLDDSMAMSPAAKLSSVPRVIVGARISKSGKAMPQAGDLQGLAMPAAVGTSGLKIEINEALTR